MLKLSNSTQSRIIVFDLCAKIVAECELSPFYDAAGAEKIFLRTKYNLIITGKTFIIDNRAIYAKGGKTDGFYQRAHSLHAAFRGGR